MAVDDQAALPEAARLICLLFILLVPAAGAGLSLINTGLSRSRSAAHSVLLCLATAAVAILVYFVCGFALQGINGHAAHSLSIIGKQWSWIGSGPLFFRGLDFDGSRASLTILLQMFTVALTAMIPVASGAERWRLGASCASTALLAGCTYPLFAYWVWSAGWLSQLGSNYALGHGFVDPGGASCIQIMGGLTALSIAWILGPRRGKFSAEGIPTAMPGHSAVIVLFGCILALLGWLGLNSAGSVLFAGARPSQAVLVAVNTTLSAASAALAALFTTRVRFGKPDASLTANGWVSGLVASSAVACFVKPAEAVLIGLVAGALVIFAIEIVELRMTVDDPAGAVSVHAAGGIWGILALGIFGHFPGENSNGNSGQFLAQLVGVATLIGFILPMIYGLNWLLDHIMHQRVAPEGERQGMDLFELGAGAYPDFVTQREDIIRR